MNFRFWAPQVYGSTFVYSLESENKKFAEDLLNQARLRAL